MQVVLSVNTLLAQAFYVIADRRSFALIKTSIITNSTIKFIQINETLFKKIKKEKLSLFKCS